jgi:prepilin-type N-terminal cleavage/methylation domain-containing protein
MRAKDKGMGTRLALRAPSVTRLPAPPRRSHGFTLIEVLAVLAMISVIVLSASPTFVRLMRDRRVNRAAMQLVDYLRTGRTMAIGRGQPIVVSWNATGILPQTHTAGTGAIQLVEPVVTGTGVGIVNNCNQTAWGTAATQVVSAFDVQNGSYDYTYITFYDDANTTPNYTEICFSPTGRMWLREGSAGLATGSFHLVLGVPAFSVLNYDPVTGVQQGPLRRVFVPPNGMARMQL